MVTKRKVYKLHILGKYKKMTTKYQQRRERARNIPGVLGALGELGTELGNTLERTARGYAKMFTGTFQFGVNVTPAMQAYVNRKSAIEPLTSRLGKGFSKSAETALPEMLGLYEQAVAQAQARVEAQKEKDMREMEFAIRMGYMQAAAEYMNRTGRRAPINVTPSGDSSGGINA